MRAIVVTDQAAGTAGMKLVERPEAGGGARQPLGRELRRCRSTFEQLEAYLATRQA